MKKRKVYMVLFSLLLACFVACGTDDNVWMPDVPERPVVIVFENDVHCSVDGYAKLVGLREWQRVQTPYVTTVSCGDFVQGDVVGSVSHGKNIVEIMNEVGYDVVALGNHEFDYGMTQMFRLTEALDASVVCANFRDLRTDDLPFPAYRILRYGEVDIAYVGFITTTTSTSTSPKTFQDEQGNYIYDFMQETFYENAQRQIDAARAEGADYVVALAHLGDLERGEHANSINLIARTTGLDAVLDGHDHHIISDTLICNREGAPVLLASTGTKFSHIGLLTLSSDGKFHSTLVPVGEAPKDEAVGVFVETVKEKALADGQKVVGVSDVNLSIYDKDGHRIVRSQETPIGDFCADAFRLVLNADVAMVNGGGIRADLPQGEVTYNHLLALFPFNNTACTATMTGQQLLDALEVSVSFLPYEDGTFMQVSGMKFEVDASVPSPVVLDEAELFSHVADAPRRVGGLQILDKESGEYLPVDLDKRYTLASFSFLLKDLGGFGIFRYAELQEDNLGQDVEVLASYIETVLNGRIGKGYSEPEGRIVMK